MNDNFWGIVFITLGYIVVMLMFAWFFIIATGGF